MQSPASLTYSQRRARFLLAAWNSGSLSRLEAALEPISDPATFTSDEEERMEMVAEVECSLRTWLNRSERSSSRKNDVSLLVALKLLRHLAGCEALVGVPELPLRGFQVAVCLV
jgi:hypothetical protein